MIKKFLQNWNYKKHAAAVTGVYIATAIVGNTLLGKKVPEDEKSLCPANVCRQMTKKQWVFNGILSGLYSIDMSLTYVILNRCKKQYK